MANWLTFDQVAAVARQTNWQGEQLVIAVAIAAGESGGTHLGEFRMNAEAIGDVELTQKEERSVGLWQINYRPLRDKKAGPGSVRDPIANLDPVINARNAYTISRGGTDWTPWSVYTSGKYRQYLPQAREAVGLEGSVAPTGDPGQPVAYHRPILPALPIRLGGLALAGEIGNAVIGGRIELTTDEVSELTLSIEDPRLQLLEKERLTIGTAVDYLDMRFEIISLEVSQGDASPVIRIACHPTGTVAMRSPEHPPTPAADMTPTDYMSRIAKAVGLAFRGEQSAVRATIGPIQIDDPTYPGGSRLETAWEVGARLADELGFLAFEAAGTYHFAGPFYLNQSAPARQVVWLNRTPYPAPAAGPPIPLIELPTCSATRVAQSGAKRLLRDVTIEGRVPREPGVTLRPGINLILAGVPVFRGAGRMITRVAWSLSDLISPVEFTAQSFEYVEGSKLTEEDRIARGVGITQGANDTALHGSQSSLDFVTFCLRQVGDVYIYGAETRLDDPDPDAFDCSELIQWAAAQVGVTFVDGSANQIAAIRRAGTTMTIAAAARTRGALLYRPGHIAVSLGDGKNTVEARGRKYGVVQGPVDGRGWTEAGTIPGMAYR